MKRQRINLFRQVSARNNVWVAIPRFEFSRLKSDFTVLYSVMVVVLFGAVAGLKYRNHRNEMAFMDNQLKQKNDDLNAVASELERRKQVYLEWQEKLKTKTVAERAIAEVKENVASVNLDSSWSSVLWKLSTTTLDPIVLHRLELQRSGSGGRRVDISGKADSLMDLKNWLETLNTFLPKSEFMVESQSRPNEKFEDINFKVVGKIS